MILKLFIAVNLFIPQHWTYEEIMNVINERLGSGMYTILINNYYQDNDTYPHYLEEIYESLGKEYSKKDMETIEARHFIDPLSKRHAWFLYIPLYDSDFEKIVSYLLISSGYDGVMDNDISASMKIRENEWKSKLKLYNPNEFDGSPAKAYLDCSKIKAASLRGGKDLLIFSSSQCDY